MYPIIHVPDDAPEQPEQLGTKLKFWFWDGDRHYLFKEGRPNTGENWAEKVCCELCELLGVPHSHYEFANWKHRRGVVSPTFVPKGSRLILGNELLAKFHSDYDGTRGVRAQRHTVSRVMAIMHGRLGIKISRGVVTVLQAIPIEMPLQYTVPQEIGTVAGVFVGYLMLDALVGNQDRHDENWGLILSPDNQLTLAPTFDHASSLGRNEQDAERSARLTTRDPGYSVERYVERARSALYDRVGGKALTTLAAFEEATKLQEVREAKNYWLGRLATIGLADFWGIFENIPAAEMTEPAKEFACKMLEINRGRLLCSGSRSGASG
ncbi:MAG: HipA domain-containing protein [Acidiferrobacter sp.]